MIYFFDGAMGTMLQSGGLKPGACPEEMNVIAPDVVKDIQLQYLAAGPTIIETNTFGASRLKLDHYGFEDRVQEFNAAAVRIAKSAIAQSGKTARVAGSMGPTGRFIEPLGDLGFEEAYDSFHEQATALADAGADMLIIETCIDIQEMRAALLAAKNATNLPVVCQLSYSEDGRTVTGTDPQSAAVVVGAVEADEVAGVEAGQGLAHVGGAAQRKAHGQPAAHGDVPGGGDDLHRHAASAQRGLEPQHLLARAKGRHAESIPHAHSSFSTIPARRFCPPRRREYYILRESAPKREGGT